MESNTNSKKKIPATSIIISLLIVIIILLVIGIAFYVKGNSEEKDKQNNINTENANQANDTIAKAITNTECYYWQNPNEEQKEYIDMGMQGGTIYFDEENKFSVDGGNGSFQIGHYYIKNDIVICNIENQSSAWHKEPEKLENTVEIQFKYTESDNQLEVVNISKQELTFHTIDMITGELTEETKDIVLEQFAVGNIYSSRNIYSESIM